MINQRPDQTALADYDAHCAQCEMCSDPERPFCKRGVQLMMWWVKADIAYRDELDRHGFLSEPDEYRGGAA